MQMETLYKIMETGSSLLLTNIFWREKLAWKIFVLAKRVI